MTFADGKDKKVSFKVPKIIRRLPEPPKKITKEDLKTNFERIHSEARSIFRKV